MEYYETSLACSNCEYLIFWWVLARQNLLFHQWRNSCRFLPWLTHCCAMICSWNRLYLFQCHYRFRMLVCLSWLGCDSTETCPYRGAEWKKYWRPSPHSTIAWWCSRSESKRTAKRFQICRPDPPSSQTSRTLLACTSLLRLQRANISRQASVRPMEATSP